MKNIINRINLLLLLLFSAQSVQPMAPLTGAALTAAGLTSLQLYKQYVEPKFTLQNLVPKNAPNGAEVLGKALAQATQKRNYKEILFGVSSACSQNESDSGNSTVSQKYIEKHKPENVLWPTVGNACLSDQCWQNDNQKVTNLGCQLYRFSVDWSRIQPTKEDAFDTTVLNRYADQCKDLINRGITPLICFHHYSDPIWFMEAGGFETKENTNLFVRFTEKVIAVLGAAGVQHWLVMNQPLAYIDKGYVVGLQPPFKKALIRNPWREVVRNNILAAHESVFKIIKKINQKIDSPQKQHKVGISHQIVPMRAHRYWNLIDPLIAYIADRSFNSYFLNFAKKHKNDFHFMALSFYSPCRFKLEFSPLGLNKSAFWNSERKDNETGDAGRIIDAQGFYDATVRVADAIGKDKPIIVIESGIDADESTPAGIALKINYFNKTMSALVKTILDGYNIQGFCVWGLMDNYEWIKGYDAFFGMYTRRTDADNMGELKPGGQYYQRIIAAYHKEMAHIESKTFTSAL